MTITSPLVPASKTAGLSIHFLVIGGGIAGLSCAIALSRVGHRVTVLERHSDIGIDLGGTRMPPNLSKVLYHWGLEKEVLRFGLRSEGIDVAIFETGEEMGRHSWDKEMIRETRGEFIFSHYADLRRLLYDTALACGVEIRLGIEVTEIDPVAGKVKVAGGETYTGDVIVGADGELGLSRTLMVQAQHESDLDEPRGQPQHRYNCYSTTIPREIIMQDSELSPLLSGDFKRMFAWYGTNCSVLLIPLNTESSAMQLFLYTPKDGNEGTWETEAPVSGLLAACAHAESRIQKLAKLAPRAPACLPIVDHPELEDWVHDSGRLVIIGAAAHPMPAGGIQDLAMPLEDGAVLAKLFSHLRTEDQIESLLNAFQELRQPHVKKVKDGEMGVIDFLCMPECEARTFREATLRTRRDAGLDAFAENSVGEEMPQWTEIKDVFGYDAEDDADNWWMEWGLLRERARGTDVKCGFVEPIAIKHADVNFVGWSHNHFDVIAAGPTTITLAFQLLAKT